MDALTSGLLRSQLTKDINRDSMSTPPPSAFASLYKCTPGKLCNQAMRRHDLLKRQRTQRHDINWRIRCLVDGVNDDDDEVNGHSNDEATDVVLDKPPSNNKKRKSISKSKQLMMSEWMEEVPTDLRDEWLVTMCPVGKRCLVVAARGSTRSFDRHGNFICKFPSNLPGGHMSSTQARDGQCILDCIYDGANNTFHVLDIMCWKDSDYYGCDTEFRHYWLLSKLSDVSVDCCSHFNPRRFIPLPKMCPTPETFSTLLSPQWSAVEGCKPDGLLFWSKRSHYVLGVSPLQLWVKPHMLPELGLI